MLDPFIDIVILNYNGKKYLDDCIKSVQKSNYQNKCIYILDNASTDDSVFYIKQNYPTVQIIQNTKNNGYCAAYNLALNACTSKYFVCLNNDVIVKQDWLSHLVKLAESDNSIAAIQPKLVSYFNEKEFEYAGASGGLMDVYGFPFLRGRLFDTIEQDHQQYDEIVEIFWTTGACMFIRKDAINEVGNFDETIVHHMDEIDLCWRLRMGGYKLLVEPKSVIKHIGGATIQSKSFKKVYWNHRNSLYIMLKNYQLKNVFKYLPLHVILDYVFVLQCLLKLDFSSAGAVIKGHLWLIINLPLINKKRKLVQQKRKIADKDLLNYLYQGSIVFEYFFKNRKTCSQLKKPYNYEYRISA